MLKKIAKLIDFNLNKMGIVNVIEEFNHKYAGSWCLINNNPMFIGKLKVNLNMEPTIVANNIDNNTLTLKEIDTIESLSPKTGLYINKDKAIYLYRIPNRQWTKGLLFGSNYSYKYLNKVKLMSELEIIKLITDKNTNYEKESAIINDKVFLHWKEIGTFDNYEEKIHLKNNHFLKELQEIWPQYQITLDANNHNAMEEKLILDF